MSLDFKSWKLLFPHRHRLLRQTTKQPLSNFEPRKPWKYNNFEAWDLTLLVIKKSVGE